MVQPSQNDELLKAVTALMAELQKCEKNNAGGNAGRNGVMALVLLVAASIPAYGVTQEEWISVAAAAGAFVAGAVIAWFRK